MDLTPSHPTHTPLVAVPTTLGSGLGIGKKQSTQPPFWPPSHRVSQTRTQTALGVVQVGPGHRELGSSV